MALPPRVPRHRHEPKSFRTPTPTADALAQLDAWLASPSLRLLSEETGYLDIFQKLVRDGRIKGGKIHDARVAALAIFHGVDELLTADRDFSRFPALAVRNPL